MTTDAEVTVYAARTCPFCVRAEKLLRSKGVAYRRERIWMYLPGGRRPLVERFGEEHTSVPQIVIGGEHVGGCDDLIALEQSGRLDELLGRA